MILRLNLLVALFFISFYSNAKEYSFDEAKKLSSDNSKIIKVLDKQSEVAKKYVSLSRSYHFPVLSISQNYAKSNNPINAFAFKLGQEKFTMADFMIDKLNNPDKTKNHQTQLMAVLPVDIFGKIRNSTSEAKEYEKVAMYDVKNSKKEITRNLYTLYVANFNLNALQDFLQEEVKYLQKIISSYDAKGQENKNRYLSYNQARIILEDMNASIKTLDEEKNKLKENAIFITGLDDFEFKNEMPENTKLKNILSEQFNKTDFYANRFDLLSLESKLLASKYEVKKNISNLLPEAFVFAQHQINSQKFLDSDGKNNTVGIELRLSFGASSAYNVSVAKAKEMVMKKNLEMTTAKINQEVLNLKHDLDKLDLLVKSASKKDQLFKENKKILTSQYQRGSVELYNMLDNFIHYLENYAKLKELETLYHQTLINYSDNFVEL